MTALTLIAGYDCFNYSLTSSECHLAQTLSSMSEAVPGILRR